MIFELFFNVFEKQILFSFCELICEINSSKFPSSDFKLVALWNLWIIWKTLIDCYYWLTSQLYGV